MYGLNLFHSYEKEVTEVIKKLEEIYSKIRVTWGKKHYYLGMDLDLTDEGKDRSSMEE